VQPIRVLLNFAHHHPHKLFVGHAIGRARSLVACVVVSSLMHPRCCAVDRPTDTRCARAPGNRVVL
jgi:hypothetical protein